MKRLFLLLLDVRLVVALVCAAGFAGCGSHGGTSGSTGGDSAAETRPDTVATAESAGRGTFGYDLTFVGRHDPNLLVFQNGSSKVIVSPKYQAKVFTSTASGDGGVSFGWVHYKAFDGPVDAHMNGYGGEDRLWLGPEGGKFSLFFAPGAKMEFANWHTPGAFDTAAWDVVKQTDESVDLRKDMQLVNYAGTHLSLSVDRQITMLTRGAIDSMIGLPADTSVKAVGYRTINRLTNTGGQAWTEKTGMPCMWLLDMFPPSAKTTILIPYNSEGNGKTSITNESGKSTAIDATKPATTDYFGEIPADRISYSNGLLRFKADGKSRGKLGMHPVRAKNVAGSYDSVHHVLTIILFDIAPHARYLNQEWRTDRAPFSGDAVNAYNDGPLADGSQMGPFYELESVSPAAFLPPGGAQVHRHSVFHFTGSDAGLDAIASKVLGVHLQ